MRRLYFRITVGVLCIVFLSFFLPPILFDLFGRKDREKSPPMFPRRTVEYVKNRLDNIPPAQFESELDSLRGLFNYPFRLVDSPNYSPPPEAFMPGPDGMMAGRREPDRDRLIHVPLRNAGKILIMGPIPGGPQGLDTKFLIILVSFVLGIVGVAAFLIVAPVARNLRALETAATKFGRGNLDSRAVVRSRDIIGSVSQQFNIMAESIQQLIQRERQLLQSVSHELRTPIARIRFSLDMLDTAGTPEEKQRRIQEIDDEISEIDHLVGELLDYNRFQSQQMPFDKQAIPIQAVFEEVIKRLQEFRPEVTIEISPLSESNCLVQADRILFRRAMQNLVANAIQYAKSRVVVEYRREGRVSIVDVRDDGPGIPPDKREQIMKPFYRVDQSGSRESGGVGLGLAIVSRIIELHGATITVGDAEGGGACFETRWPDTSSNSQI
jgi:signal transduction histidine kinase